MFRFRTWFLLAIALLTLAPTPSLRSDVAQLGQNLYVAGVPTEHFEHFAAPQGQGRQRSANWCWAACIQMVLNYHGLKVTQEQIVSKIYGGLVDAPADGAKIVAALNGWVPDAAGHAAYVQAIPYIVSAAEVIRDLTYRWPLIVGLQQQPIAHAYVVTAVTYSLDEAGQPVLRGVVLRDPWPGNQSRVELSWADFAARCMFATRVYVARQ